MIALAIVTASWVDSPIVFGRIIKEKIVDVVQAGKLVQLLAECALVLESKQYKFSLIFMYVLIFQTAASKESISGHDFLVGHVYRGVETLGKELFMYFDQKALR